MSIYRTRPLTLDRVKTYPLRSRPSKVSISDFARVPPPNASVRAWTRCLPRLLAGESFRSVLVAAYRARVPVTVHEAIGTDIIHMHPAIDARALGAATHRDFLLLAALVRNLDGGGVYLNVGSAVVLPEVFLKCVSLAANLGHAPRGITTVNLDFIQHYRPIQNVVMRPTAA